MGRRFYFCLLAGTVLSSFLLGQAPVKNQHSQAINEWKHSTKISIDLADVPFSKILQEIERQSGVRMTGRSKKEKLTLTLREVPFWKAVGETSILAGSSFLIDENELRVDFAPGSEVFPVFDRYQVIGPFHVGVLTCGTKGAPLFLLEVSSLPTEGSFMYEGICNVSLETNESGRRALEPTKVDGQGTPRSSYWIVPRDTVEKKANLRGDLRCQIFVNPNQIAFPVEINETFEFKNLGGLKARIINVDQRADKPFLEFAIEWDSGLKNADSKVLMEFFKRSRRKLDDDELKKIRKWVTAKSGSGELRLLHVTKMELIDAKQKVVPYTQTQVDEFDVATKIQGKVYFTKGREPKELRLSLSERRFGTAVFEFSNVFSK